MVRRIVFLSAVGLSVGLLSACNDGTVTTPAATQASIQSVNTAQVLAIAQTTSETSQPFPVNGGVFVINDTSETDQPIPVSM